MTNHGILTSRMTATGMEKPPEVVALDEEDEPISAVTTVGVEKKVGAGVLGGVISEATIC